mmetsp:Transcript_27730/g.54431  ORF Transcript_27730/g.54431 Transcript_27730/m.54431 type:complete len:252 (+) Transcript_27730:108-863(+)|eukprot:CAMPEP_0172664402 /NCGR_PEP_ID=MMETSP1074-20121228/6571_1 /TAXON_ID=2916 /ORGANISM="Ceratium fusus, Strain PA161109" /LENGTH=251 /DNA_ID=CAMNT_0013480545 /DNA_START=94 /DNA_END=849 /DNA_ORIENTATION=+
MIAQTAYKPCDVVPHASATTTEVASASCKRPAYYLLSCVGAIFGLVVAADILLRRFRLLPRSDPGDSLSLVGVRRPTVKLHFPMSFEDDDFIGRCPEFWICKGGAKICRHPPMSHSCNHPGIGAVDGKLYLSLGDDMSTGSATSLAFLLPTNVDMIEFKRSGGAGPGSGFYVRLLNDDSLICIAEDSLDSNLFVDDKCLGLNKYAGQAVYIIVKDTSKSIWGKVLVDNIRLKDISGKDISNAVGIPSPLRI